MAKPMTCLASMLNLIGLYENALDEFRTEKSKAPFEKRSLSLLRSGSY